MKHLNQRGVSLIEIMVALTISLFLMAGILNIFISSKQSYQIGRSLAELQENMRFVSDYLPKFIRLSGYRSTPDNTNFTSKATVFNASEPFVQVISNLGINNSDILSIRYQGSGDGAGTPDNTVMDCLNQALDANQIATNMLSINANLDLECQSINPNAPSNVTSEVLVSGVEQMKILLGEDLDNDKTADRYVPSNVAGINMDNIVSIRLGFLLRSTNEIQKVQDTKTYNILGTEYTPTPDFRIRKVVTFTVQLRNTLSN